LQRPHPGLNKIDTNLEIYEKQHCHRGNDQYEKERACDKQYCTYGGNRIDKLSFPLVKSGRDECPRMIEYPRCRNQHPENKTGFDVYHKLVTGLNYQKSWVKFGSSHRRCIRLDDNFEKVITEKQANYQSDDQPGYREKQPASKFIKMISEAH